MQDPQIKGTYIKTINEFHVVERIDTPTTYLQPNPSKDVNLLKPGVDLLRIIISRLP